MPSCRGAQSWPIAAALVPCSPSQSQPGEGLCFGDTVLDAPETLDRGLGKSVPLSSWPHRRRMNPLNVHGNGHGQHALPVFVANFDGDFAGIPLGQQVVPDARGGLCGFSLRSVKVGEL
jgi:hypothetical protein